MNIHELTIREERAGDAASIRLVHESAFRTPAEGELVDALRTSGRLLLSLVAEHRGEIIGHVAMSPVRGSSAGEGWGLAPVAVRPEFQKQGVGTALVFDALERGRQQGARYCVVLGSPAYYRRFGFLPASTWKLMDEYQGGNAFQAIELVPGALSKTGGLIQYGPEFAMFSN